MTLNDIRDEVGSLGFDEPPKDTAALVRAVRRALAIIYTERGVLSSARFFKRVPKTIVPVSEIFHPAGEEISVGADSGAYSFFVSGKGEVTINDSSGSKSYSFDTRGKRYFGCVNGSATLSFTGASCFSVYNFFLYPDFYSERECDVPTSTGSEEYPLTELISDYFCALEAPRAPSGKLIPGSEILSDRIILPSSYCGEVTVSYRKAPPRVSADTPEEKLDIPKDTEHLLPLLTAAYMWLDDDSEKAYYYMSLYREGMAALKLYNSRSVDTGVGDVTGWA